jgi:hypothetical protein
VNPIAVSLAAEGMLDEIVLRQLIKQSGKSFEVTACYGLRGKDHLRENIVRFNRAAVHKPFIVLTDLDDEDCPPGLIGRWLPHGQHSNLVLRIAVTEIESWLLADAARFADFLGVRADRLPEWPDMTPDPKAFTVSLAQRSRRRSIREDIVPASGTTAQVGRNYVGRLMEFATISWQIDKAACRHSPSLNKAMTAVQSFSPKVATEVR